MHSIIDIAQEMYPDLEVCVLDTIKHDQQLIDDAIVTWKKKNCKVLVYCLDNFVNDSKHIEHFKSEYENDRQDHTGSKDGGIVVASASAP